MRRPKPRQKSRLSPQEELQLAVYNDLMYQYRKIGIDWGIPMQAVRLYVRRLNGWYSGEGLKILLGFLAKPNGVPMVMERCRREITLRQEFFAGLIAKTLPKDPELRAKALLAAEPAMEEMAEDLAILDAPEGGLRLLAYLERLRTRAVVHHPGNDTVH